LALVFSVLPLASLAQAPTRLERLSVETAEATEARGRPVIRATFAGADAEALSRFSAAHVGRTIEIVVDGAVVSRMRLAQPITAGVLEISSALSRDATLDLAGRLADGIQLSIVVSD
jgi:preprotein translocase subunit SecD